MRAAALPRHGLEAGPYHRQGLCTCGYVAVIICRQEPTVICLIGYTSDVAGRCVSDESSTSAPPQQGRQQMITCTCFTLHRHRSCGGAFPAPSGPETRVELAFGRDRSCTAPSRPRLQRATGPSEGQSLHFATALLWARPVRVCRGWPNVDAASRGR